MKNIFVAAAALAVIAFAGTANAAAVNMAKDVGLNAPDTAVELVRHGGPTCELGRNGWHYHSRRGERIECNPRPQGRFYGWRCEGPRCGWYHRGYRRFY
jgi:hypothetical protein